MHNDTYKNSSKVGMKSNRKIHFKSLSVRFNGLCLLVCSGPLIRSIPNCRFPVCRFPNCRQMKNIVIASRIMLLIYEGKL